MREKNGITEYVGKFHQQMKINASYTLVKYDANFLYENVQKASRENDQININII